MNHLSKRLEKISSFILPDTKIFADIGSDHALLPCAICLKDKFKRAVVSDLRKGPIQSAKQTIKYYALEDRISVRLGSGLSVLKPFEVEEAIISGMGGTLIAQVLEEDSDILQTIDRMIIQPNIDSTEVRQTLNKFLFHIVDESIVKDRKHLYEVIVAEKRDTKQKLSEKELFFGPYLLKTQPKLFLEKINRDKRSIENILKNLQQSSNGVKKEAVFIKHLKWMEEIITNVKEQGYN